LLFLGELIGQSGDQQLMDIYKGTSATYDDRTVTEVRGNEAATASFRTRTITFYRDSLSLTVPELGFLTAHEFAHLLPENNALNTLNLNVTNPAAPPFEVHADDWASRFLRQPVPPRLNYYQENRTR
jgi:hypothetical protein